MTNNHLTTPDAIDLLIKPDTHGNWPHDFERNGRSYTLVHGEGVSSAGDSVVFCVWNDCAGVRTGRKRYITVRPTDKVSVLTYLSPVGGRVYPA